MTFVPPALVMVSTPPVAAVVSVVATWVTVSVASRREVLDELFDAVQREAESQVPGEVIDTGRDFIEGSDGGPGGWEGDWR
jgi:heme exporter protein D